MRQHTRLLRGSHGERVATLTILTILATVLVWNATTYPPTGGYDASEHIAYAHSLIDHGTIPGRQGRTEYYTPPGFYALAGSATWLGQRLGLTAPERAAQALNAAIVLATALLVLALARLLLPENTWAQISALAFFAFLPVVTQLAAMFHPEPLDLLLSTLSLYLAVRLLRLHDYRLRTCAFLGATLGVGQLVRAFSLWTFAAVVITFTAAGLGGYTNWRTAARTIGVVIAITAIVAGPWYIRQATRYSNPIFDRPTKTEPPWRRRPLSFYIDLGLPTLFTNPARPSFINQALPTTYTGLWGDYEGYFAWGYGKPPSRPPATILAAQNALGLIPTLLAIAGWLLLLRQSLRRSSLTTDPAPLLIALLPAAALLGYLYFTVSYPTPNGNVLKASYMLTATPAWALSFAIAVQQIARRRRLATLAAALLLCSLPLDLTFLYYRI